MRSTASYYTALAAFFALGSAHMNLGPGGIGKFGQDFYFKPDFGLQPHTQARRTAPSITQTRRVGVKGRSPTAVK
jgi:hypothetical protein